MVVFGAVVATIGCSANVGGNCFSAGGTSGGAGSSATVCGTTTCLVHTYCANPAGAVCSDGCTKDSDCANSETCDLSNAVTDLGGNVVGTCKVKSISDQQSSSCTDGGANADGGDTGPKDAGSD